ncbi:MAG: flagellar brake protein [Deltaproteobacteria bacterium]|nr:flagellar brake protein [Deltaproteobacteria bacterium]
MTADNAGYTPFHLAIGSEVLIEIEALKLRIKCTLVGLETGQYIIIRLSDRDLVGNFRSEHIKSGQLLVRYLYQSAVYGFRAELLNVISTPAKIFFLSYPSKIEEYVMRERDRFDCVLPAGTMLDNEIVDMVIIDISTEGCQCVIKAAAGRGELYNYMQVNKVLDISVQFPGKEGIYRLSGRVRNLSKGADKITLGVKFEGLAPAASERIKEFISLVSSARK